MKNLLTGLFIGFLAALFFVGLAAYFVITSGIIPARQDEPAGDFERWAAKQSLRATVRRETAGVKCPLNDDEENLLSGAKVYADHCSFCHGAPQTRTPAAATSYSPGAPLFANGDSVADDPIEKIHWKVEHGIRFTGMPAFNKMLNEKEIWQVSLFLKNADKLPEPVNKFWQEVK